MQFTFAFGAKIKKIVGWEKEKEIKNLEIPVAENERNKAVENLLSLKEYFDNQLKSDQETYQAIATLGDKLGVLWNGDK